MALAGFEAAAPKAKLLARLRVGLVWFLGPGDRQLDRLRALVLICLVALRPGCLHSLVCCCIWDGVG